MRFAMEHVRACMSRIGSLDAIVLETSNIVTSSVWRRQILPCLLAAIVGIGVSVIAGRMTVLRDDRSAKLQFDVVAENHFMILQNGINEYVEKLRTVRALFDSSDGPVPRNVFELFTRPLLQENSAITTLSWVPRVLNAERTDHERAAVLQGLSGYRIKSMGTDGKMSPSPERGEYYPIFYATVPTTSPLFGLDLRSEPQTLEEMERARDENRLCFSQVRELVSSDGTQSGFLFSMPVYRHGSPHDSIEDRRRNLAGYVHGSLIPGKMIESIITANKTPQGMELFFFEPGTDLDALPMYVHKSRLEVSPIQPMSLSSLALGQHWSRDLMADGQRWLTMAARPMPGGPLAIQDHRAWFIFAFGLFITGVLVTYIRSSGQHALRMIEANQTASDLAQKDALTSLANRRAFVGQLNDAFAACRRGAKPFAVLYFDLDHFKDINDTLGHSVGDAILRQVAARVTGAIRENDVVARFGGDEFAIIQGDTQDPTAVGTLATKIGKILAEPYFVDGNEVRITVSIGVSCYAADVVGPDAMMIQADLALYRAKEDGRNCFRFHSANLDHEVEERVIITDELRGAAERGELELYYQPQVELRSGRIVGLEALLRWNHPERGQIPPNVFIPIAERSGQIHLLGQWVLDDACRQLKTWQAAGIAPALVGVNFSALHFKGSPDLDLDVGARLDKWGIAPDTIEIELTESVLMDITQQHHDRFERLRQLGIRIAIDDFGTGYSSLNYLASYPINRVKIAQELVFRVDTDPRCATVVRAAVRLARELGIEVIAEGVETDGQRRFLLSAGCEHGQGFYFSKPVNAERATELLRLGKIMPFRRPLPLLETTAA
jgi:diguanylate cyclase (GGDEF)-like protein